MKKLDYECVEHPFKMEYDGDECPVCEMLGEVNQANVIEMDELKENHIEEVGDLDSTIGSLEQDIEDLNEQFPPYGISI